MIDGISKERWKNACPIRNPFLKFEFLEALKSSGSIGPGTGWQEKIFAHPTRNDFLMTFIKDHSYGEYIFDWGWAEAYQRYGIPYYPKLTAMIPFTPVTTTHFMMKEFNQEAVDELMGQFESYYLENNFSGAHFLFLAEGESIHFENHGYLIRESIQYHFQNKGFTHFDDYLNQMKPRKKKVIKKERHFEHLVFTSYSHSELTEAHAKSMYQFYLSTIVNKNSFDYLNEHFFLEIFKTLSENMLYVEASRDNVPVAGSLFFYDEDTLYGRYWGTNTFVQNLHFELCYYQGIDFCIKNKLKIFEAGAQGEHKIARGFRPVKTFSAHKLKHPAFHKAIEEYIENEKIQVRQALEELSNLLPWKE